MMWPQNSPGSGGSAGAPALDGARMARGADVEFVAELGRGADSTVFHVRRAGSPYALKVLHSHLADGQRLGAAFGREAALLARVDHPGVPRVYDVGVTDGRPYLVMELLDGRSLAEVMETSELTEGQLVRLATDVAAALGAAHRAGVVHRDIKPTNIMITDDGRSRLIDFGLAALDRGAPAADSAVGTFDYSAPEQTGMLNRPVDGRSDLYALGVVLFQCATGRLPFRSDDVGELIAMHASTPAPDPRTLRPGLSAGLAAAIGRLLTKDPDDRFQTAGQLLDALAHLPTAPPSGSGPPACHPVASPLAGRDDEQAALAARWARARAGGGGVVLISGAPGGGKTGLAAAVAATARSQGALVLSGKCDADAALPLAALRNAIEEHLRAVAALPPAEQAEVVHRLRVAAGPGASLLRPLSPRLSIMLDVPALATDDRHDQFAGAVASFLTALVGETGGLLVLDDVHWLDEASRGVLRRLAEDIDGSPLLVVATARDDDASAGGIRAFEAAAGAALDLRVPIGRLDEAATAHLVSTYLAGSAVGPEVVDELSARGHGNPFTILEYLRSLIDAGALRPSWGTWCLDTALLQEINLPTDVLDLVLARVDGLDEFTGEVLTVAAAIGNVVDTSLLAEVTAANPAAANLPAALAEAVDRGLVHPRAGGFAFVHDRIREALLSTVDPPDLRALHQRIATVLDRWRRADAATTYAIARHYANGESDRTPERVFATGWAAGQLALDENAPDAAVSFLESADTAARGAGITPDSRFREALGVAYWSTGRVEPARRHLEVGLAAETDPARRAALLLQLSHVLRTGWDLTGALSCARQGLAELGAGVPDHPVLMALGAARTMLRWLATGSRPPAAEPARGETAERLRLQVLLARAAVAAAAINLKHGQVVAFSLHPVPYAYRLGVSDGYLSHLSSIGTVAGSMGLRARRDRIYRRARELATDLGDPKAYANAAWSEAFSKVLGREILVREWADVCEAHRRYLEVDFYTNILLMRCRDLVQRGYAVEALTWHDRGRSRISEATADAFPGFGVLADMAGALLGHASDAPAVLAARSAEPLDAGHAIQFMLGAVQTALEQDELKEPFERAVEAFGRLGLSLAAIFTEYRMYFAYVAFGRLTQLQRATGADRARRLTAARTAVKALTRAATKAGPAAGPLALTLLRGYDAVARASLAQLTGRDGEALDVLAKGEPVLVRLDAPLVEYEAARVRARALARLGEKHLAERHAAAALGLAVEHGWTCRARWIRTEFGTAVTAQPRSSGPYGGSDSVVTASVHQRRLDALQQVSMAAAKVLDPHQLARVALDETLRILGAERAILFLADERDGALQPSLGRDANGTDLAEMGQYSSTLVNRVAAERRPLVITGSDEGAALGSRSAVVYGLRSIMIAPLELDERLIGVVYLDSRVARGVFTDADVDILTAVSSHIAVSLETARAAQLEVAVRAVREQRDTAELLRVAMNELSSTFEPDGVLSRLLGIMARTLPADRLCVLHQTGEDRTVLTKGPVDRAAAGTALLRACQQAGHGDRQAAPQELAAVLGEARSWLAVPLRSHGSSEGVLIAGSAQVASFTHAHQDLLSALAGQAATAYDNARLFARVQLLATVDELTGAHNRRHFMARATDQVLIAQRNHRPLVGMMVDIDHFKRVNDTFGHATGDDVIRTVASVLREHIRQPDVFGRYGGEEFAVVQSEMHGDPLDLGERLRRAVEAVAPPGPDGPIRVTVSVGVAELKPDDTLEALLGRADDALYRSKRAGRNRVTAG